MRDELSEFLFVSFNKARIAARALMNNPALPTDGGEHDDDHNYHDEETKHSADLVHNLDRHLAADEHKNYNHISMFASLDEIHTKIGPNIRWYFMFGYTLLAINIVVSIAAFILLGLQIHFLSLAEGLSINNLLTQQNPFVWLSVTRMTPQVEPFWYSLVVLNIVLTISYPWMYRAWIQVTMDRTDATTTRFDPTVRDDPYLGKTGKGQANALDIIIEKPKLREKKKPNRRRNKKNKPIHDPDAIVAEDGTALRSIQPPGKISIEMILTGVDHNVQFVNEHNNMNDMDEKQEKKQQEGEEDEKDTTVAAFSSAIGNEETKTRAILPGKDLHHYIMDDIAAIKLASEIENKKWKRRIGRTASFLAFFSLLSVNATVNYFVYSYSHNQNQFLISILLSMALTVFNAIWQIISHRVTQWEQHIFWTTFYKSFFLKTYCFRICSTIILFCISRLSLFGTSGLNPITFQNVGTNLKSTSNCPFDSLAQLYATTLITEILSSIWGSLGLTWAQKWFALHCCNRHQFGDDEYMADFVLAEEYVDLLYKQLLVLLGLSVFPAMAIGMSAAISIELLLDRAKLKYFCKRVAITNNSFKTLLILLNLINVFLGVFTPPNGALWILIGFKNGCQITF
jgi:hypothetical protein